MREDGAREEGGAVRCAEVGGGSRVIHAKSRVALLDGYGVSCSGTDLRPERQRSVARRRVKIGATCRAVLHVAVDAPPDNPATPTSS